VENNGYIHKSSSGGTNWISLSSNFNKNLRAVISSDLNKSWIVGEQGTILK